MKNTTLLYVILGITLVIFLLRKMLNKIFMFDILVGVVLKHEGGYVNDPDDLGGETKYGITKRRYPNLDIKNLTKADAIKIYKRDFYIPMEIEKISDINLAMQYFDMGVNAGINNAKTLMARAVANKKSSSKSLLTLFKEQRVEYYKKVALLRNNKKYLAGWLNRVESSKIA